MTPTWPPQIMQQVCLSVYSTRSPEKHREKAIGLFRFNYWHLQAKCGMPHMRNHSYTCLCCKPHQIEFQANSIIWNLNKYSHEAAAFKVRFTEVRAAAAAATSCGSKSSQVAASRIASASWVMRAYGWPKSSGSLVCQQQQQHQQCAMNLA